MSEGTQEALTELLRGLDQAGYRFTTTSPATHERYLAKRKGDEARDLRDIFGWSLPFSSELLPSELVKALEAAGALETAHGRFKSKVRVSTIGTALFVHSAFPTGGKNDVFFGPDTYRFIRFIQANVTPSEDSLRIVEIGAGTGAGALAAAALLPNARVTLSDINPAALRHAAANAAHARVEVELVEGSGLDAVDGGMDLVLANPPYVMDEEDRAYRDGGGMLGAQLSLDWTLSAARRLSPGGRMLLYTGVAIEAGADHLREALEEQLPPLGCTLAYEELDPDVFGEELEKPPYREVERIAVIGATITRAS
jgi:methylase of polypeptide subunit release factors